MPKTIYWYEYKSKKKKQTNNFEKVFLSWWIMQFLENEKFEKTQRSQTCHNWQKMWQKICLAIEMRKTQILMSKPVYLGSILELIKMLMYEFWYDYVNKQKAKLWKNKIMLYGYRHCIHKERSYLQRSYWCWN